MKTTLRFEGGAQLSKALEDLPQKLQASVLKEALIDAAEPMRLRMGHLAPREPPQPDMADNIVVSAVRATKKTGIEDLSGVVVAVGPAKPFFYAKFQEFGTVRHGAKPFMRPAFDSEAPKALLALKAAIWNILTGKGLRSGSTGGSGGTL